MDELIKQKLAREMTHWQPVQSERPLADMWGGMNNLQRLGLFQIPVVSDAAGLLGDLQMYRDQPEMRGLFNYGMSAAGLLPFVPGAFGRIVHHGSPHQWMPEPDFPRGRPRLDKIGTGEGAQAYGHGMYFAESPGVAREYARRLTANANWRATDLVDVDPNTEMYTAIGPKGEKRSFWNQAEALDWAREGKESLYSLDLPDERLPGLLDWDLPLSQQPKAVRKALNIKELEAAYPYADESGQSLYEAIKRAAGIRHEAKLPEGIGISPKAYDKLAAEYLLQRGIPGIQYLDAGSRGAGNGTYNYVIWDQNLLDEMARRMQ